MTKRENAIVQYDKEINENYEKLMKRSKEELKELARSKGVYTDEGRNPKSWIAYDIAVKNYTGY